MTLNSSSHISFLPSLHHSAASQTPPCPSTSSLSLWTWVSGFVMWKFMFVGTSTASYSHTLSLNWKKPHHTMHVTNLFHIDADQDYFSIFFFVYTFIRAASLPSWVTTVCSFSQRSTISWASVLWVRVTREEMEESTSALSWREELWLQMDG